MDPKAEEELLENWIKELEQGMAGMTGVIGSKPPTVCFVCVILSLSFILCPRIFSKIDT